MTCPSSMHETGDSKFMHWDTAEGLDGEGNGREFWNGGHMSICG